MNFIKFVVASGEVVRGTGWWGDEQRIFQDDLTFGLL